MLRFPSPSAHFPLCNQNRRINNQCLRNAAPLWQSRDAREVDTRLRHLGAERQLGYARFLLQFGSASSPLQVDCRKGVFTHTTCCVTAAATADCLHEEQPSSWFAPLKKCHVNLPLCQNFPLLMPFLAAEWPLICKAWTCTFISVLALFFFIPLTGQISSILGKGDLQCLSQKCVCATFLLAVRSGTKFLQQSLLWEVALRVTYNIRCHVFERVVQNDTAYFEGRGAATSGDIAYRITAEAQDTGDSVYSLLEIKLALMRRLPQCDRRRRADIHLQSADWLSDKRGWAPVQV
ncbi:hypothetical protein L7F22_028176 [Adiantum nelumboides]|nr:hypothetical protein [Adiantum nelumboides]